MPTKILFLTLSNIGDVILTLPALDWLKENFPGSEIAVLVGPRPKAVFENNPHLAQLLVYDKHSAIKEKIRLYRKLKSEHFDIVIDLRNTLLGFLLPARLKISPFLRIPKNIVHMRDKHLYKVRSPEFGVRSEVSQNTRTILQEVKPEDELYIRKTLEENGINQNDKIIVISAGARSHIKRWPKEKFVELICAMKQEFNFKIVLVGDREDVPINRYIAEHLSFPVLDLSAKTTISQLAGLLEKAELLLTNDSAVLHLASYLDIPVVAIFGPTSEIKYGPWSKVSRVVKKDIFCRPCQKAQCRFGTLECMQIIGVDDVLRRVRDILSDERRKTKDERRDSFRRILLVRTDRIGDVLLSTPVIKALRDRYPQAYLAMMVSPQTKDIVEGNPYLDAVIIYDKDGKHKSWRRSYKFSQRLRKRKFDLAIVLHPTNRAHLVTFLAAIPKRVGFSRKCGFLLTDKIKHTKQCAEKHELEYALDLARYLGITPQDKNLFMPIREESEKWAEGLFSQEGIKNTDKLLAIHPAASCPSKIWPSQRFALVADNLKEKYGLKVLVVAGPKDIQIADAVAKQMRQSVINLAAKTSLSQLASILKRCALFISNDSGPVHIASSLGTPVISIFGRNQKGLSPERWGPVGRRDKILHKEVGCIECLAHNCLKEFACLKAITVDDVLAAAEEILKRED